LNGHNTNDPNPGYHQRVIPKGENGQITKVIEELLEFEDAHEQSCQLMMAMELSDAILAIELVAKKYLPHIPFGDILWMSKITKRAFESGRRQPKQTVE
jgi:hypothetical protein